MSSTYGRSLMLMYVSGNLVILTRADLSSKLSCSRGLQLSDHCFPTSILVQPFTGCHSQSTVWEVVPSCGTIIGCISSKATANLPCSQRTTLPWNITLNFFWEELLWLRRNTTLTGVLGDKDVSEQNIAPDAEMSTVLSSKFRSPCSAGLTATMAGRATLRRLYTLDIA